MIWEGEIDQTWLWSACRSAAGRLVITLRKKNNLFNEQKNAPNVFLN